jgi:hypothetical protein
MTDLSLVVRGCYRAGEREEHSTLRIFFVHFWPYKSLYLGGGVGRKDPGDKRQNTFRATVGYEFEFGKGWIISPQVNLYHTWVYGDGWLSCLDVESGTVWQANEAGDSRSFGKDGAKNS